MPAAANARADRSEATPPGVAVGGSGGHGGVAGATSVTNNAAILTEGHMADDVLARLFAGEGEQLLAHADREGLDPHVHGFGGQKMAELVDENQNAKEKDKAQEVFHRTLENSREAPKGLVGLQTEQMASGTFSCRTCVK